MLADTHTRRVLELASQKGLLRASDLDAINAPRVVLTRLIATGVLDRVGVACTACQMRRDRNLKVSQPSPPRRRRPCSACSRRCNFTS